MDYALMIDHQERPDRNQWYCLIYSYYIQKGFFCICLAKTLRFIMILFLAFTTLVLTTCIDDMSINIDKIKAIHPFVVTMCIIFLFFWTIKVILFIRSLGKILEIKKYYNNILKISDSQLKTISWSEVLDKLVKVQPTLDQLDITYIITRTNNYLVALYSQDFMSRAFFPESLQWNINYILTNLLLDDHRHEVYLSFYFKVFAIVNLLLMPFILMYRVSWFCFENASEIQRFSGRIAHKQWSPIAKWRMRSYCEVDHYFTRRLNSGYKCANEYTEMFSSVIAGIIAQFISFIAGGMLILLLLISTIFDERFFTAELLFGRTVTWWILITGVILAISKSFIPDENIVFDPIGKLKELKVHLKYIPDSWTETASEHTNKELTYIQFSELFRSKISIFIDEILAVFINPYVLFFILPKECAKIIAFYHNNSIKLNDNVGTICSLGILKSSPSTISGSTTAEPSPLQSYIFTRDGNIATSIDKMKNSYIDFQIRNPTWRRGDI